MSDSLLPRQDGLQYFVLDVFTRKRLTGNALAVVINPGWLTEEMMLAIARETNLSETTFVERRELELERREGVLVRIFTTEEELPFAGHPTLGTASLLRAIAPECLVGNTIKLALKVGAVPVAFDTHEADVTGDQAQWPMQAEMTQKNPAFGELLDPAAVAFLIGLTLDDLDSSIPIQVVSTGTAFAIVALRSAEALSRLRVRQDEAAAFLRHCGARWFYVLGPEMVSPATNTSSSDEAAARNALPSTPSPIRWKARMQFNGGEDPATGSAAGCAISHLVRSGAVGSAQQVLILQGVEMNRPSELFVSAHANPRTEGEEALISGVRVGGSTILVASGHLFLP